MIIISNLDFTGYHLDISGFQFSRPFRMTTFPPPKDSTITKVIAICNQINQFNPVTSCSLEVYTYKFQLPLGYSKKEGLNNKTIFFIIVWAFWKTEFLGVAGGFRIGPFQLSLFAHFLTFSLTTENRLVIRPYPELLN